tara:strand:- start:222 stop:824 length:603 start_codon:yes stop_codon:yes gene_type:complete
MKKEVNINELKNNPTNPRVIKEADFQKLLKSIREFPKMMTVNPIVVDENMIVLGGNMRLRACKELGLKKVWIETTENWTEEEKQEFVIKDNSHFGQWDWDILSNDWQTDHLNDWGLSVWENQTDEIMNVNKGDENSEWVGMPEFEGAEQPLKIVVSFLTEKHREEFAEKHSLQFLSQAGRTWSTSHPFKDKMDLKSLKYE